MVCMKSWVKNSPVDGGGGSIWAPCLPEITELAVELIGCLSTVPELSCLFPHLSLPQLWRTLKLNVTQAHNEAFPLITTIKDPISVLEPRAGKQKWWGGGEGRGGEGLPKRASFIFNH